MKEQCFFPFLRRHSHRVEKRGGVGGRGGGGGGAFFVLDNLESCIRRRRRWLSLEDVAAWDWHGAGSTSAPGAQEKGSKKVTRDMSGYRRHLTCRGMIGGGGGCFDDLRPTGDLDFTRQAGLRGRVALGLETHV